MKLAIISLKSESSRLIEKEAKELFKTVDFIDIRDIQIDIDSKGTKILFKSKPLENYDCIYCRGSHKYANLLRSLTYSLNKDSYIPMAPESFTIAHDKFLTLNCLRKNNISVPKTHMVAKTSTAKKIAEEIHYPAIIKIPSGTHGKGVMFADSIESAKSILDALEVFRQPYIIQEYIETRSTDIRAFVIGEKVVCSMKRRGVDNDRRANLHAGANGEPLVLDEESKELALKSAKAVNVEICGVDILKGANKKPVVIEVNISPGLQGITKVTKKNVAYEIAKYLHEKSKEFKKQKSSHEYNNVLSELNLDKKNEIITNLNMKAGIIKIPESISKLSGLKPDDEVKISVKKNFIRIKKE